MMRDSAGSDDIIIASKAKHGVAAPSMKILSNGCGLVEGGDGIDPDLAAQYEGGPFPMVLIQAPSESLARGGGGDSIGPRWRVGGPHLPGPHFLRCSVYKGVTTTLLSLPRSPLPLISLWLQCKHGVPLRLHLHKTRGRILSP